MQIPAYIVTGRKGFRARSFRASWALGGNTLRRRRRTSDGWAAAQLGSMGCDVVAICSLANDNSKPLYTLGARWFESLMLTLGTKWYYAEPPRVFTAEGLYGG